MIAKKAIALCVTLSLALVGTWTALGLGVASATSDGSNFWVEFLSYLASHFGELTIGVATVFYVVFTYLLLQSREIERRHVMEPMLAIRWRYSQRSSEVHLDKAGELALGCRQWLIDTVNISTSALDEQVRRAMRDNEGFLGIEFSNARERPIAWIEFGITGAATIPGQKPIRMRDKKAIKELDLGQEPIMVTVADLTAIPKSAKVEFTIDLLAYGTGDGEIVSKESVGQVRHETVGALIVGESAAPQPD